MLEQKSKTGFTEMADLTNNDNVESKLVGTELTTKSGRNVGESEAAAQKYSYKIVPNFYAAEVPNE